MLLRLLTALGLAALPGVPVAETPADAGGSGPGDTLILTDFTAATPALDWYIQNDNVMGGRSQGGFDIVAGELVFAGSTNTNGGGFSSIRTRRFKLDLSAYDGLELKLRADGREYTWQLATNARNSGYPVSYWAEFDTRAGLGDDAWETVRIPFTRFYPHFRGFKLNGPPLDPADLTEFGLYIYDKKDGPFEMHLDSIAGYPAADAVAE